MVNLTSLVFESCLQVDMSLHELFDVITDTGLESIKIFRPFAWRWETRWLPDQKFVNIVLIYGIFGFKRLRFLLALKAFIVVRHLLAVDGPHLLDLINSLTHLRFHHAWFIQEHHLSLKHRYCESFFRHDSLLLLRLTALTTNTALLLDQHGTESLNVVIWTSALIMIDLWRLRLIWLFSFKWFHVYHRKIHIKRRSAAALICLWGLRRGRWYVVFENWVSCHLI